jgi:hypothetical protein
MLDAMRHDSREERKKCSAVETRRASGFWAVEPDEVGGERRAGFGRDERPIPSQSRKKVRRCDSAELSVVPCGYEGIGTALGACRRSEVSTLTSGLSDRLPISEEESARSVFCCG